MISFSEAGEIQDLLTVITVLQALFFLSFLKVFTFLIKHFPHQKERNYILILTAGTHTDKSPNNIK